MKHHVQLTQAILNEVHHKKAFILQDIKTDSSSPSFLAIYISIKHL